MVRIRRCAALVAAAFAVACAAGRATGPTAEGATSTVPPPASERSATLGVGDPVPDFALTAQDGTTVRLDALRAQGPVVVVFYRGDW